MHLMIGIICITATLVFDESESAGRVSMHMTFAAATVPCLGDIQSACSASWSGDVAAHKASIAKGVLNSGRLRRRDGRKTETGRHEWASC